MHKHQHLEQQQQCGGRFGYHGEALKMLTTRGFGLLGSLPESQSRVRCCVSCAVWCVLPQSKRLQCPLTMPHAADSTVVGRAFSSAVVWRGPCPPPPVGSTFISSVSQIGMHGVCATSLCASRLCVGVIFARARVIESSLQSRCAAGTAGYLTLTPPNLVRFRSRPSGPLTAER